jgi:hypothetical protein
MRHFTALACLLAAAQLASFSATAASLPRVGITSQSMVETVGSRGYRAYRGARDCTPTNGPFGFYGNIWCQPPGEASYLRNLGAQWPMATPPSLRYPKPSQYGSTDW